MFNPFVHQIDINAKRLLNNHTNFNNYEPIKTGADGNCLFRAASRSLYGTELNHIELRARSIIEIILNINNFSNPNNYANNEYLEILVAISSQNNKYGTLREVFLSEAIRCSQIGEWSSPIMVYAIANSVGININQIYPCYSRGIKERQIMNSLISPFKKDAKVSQSSLKDVFFFK